MKNVVVGVVVAAVAAALGYLVQPEVVTQLVAANPKLAVVMPIVTGIIGVFLPQLKVWASKV